jgi:hypothetical protein
VNFSANTIAYPPGLSNDERQAIATQVLVVPKPSPSYARYRREWLEPIAAAYRAAGIPVIFVRIPTRPVHRSSSERPSGSLTAIARDQNARLLAAAPYLELERPDFFADEDHLNREGSTRFSRQLGRDVAAVLAGRALPAAAPIPTQQEAAPPPLKHHRFSWLNAIVGIGIPLRFQSYEFWLFVAIVAALFYGLPRRAGRYVLLIASYYFYARWNAWYVLFLLILTASDFLIAIALERGRARKREPRLLLGLGIAANLAFLGSFKYTNFASGTVSALLGMHENPWLVNLFVPIGISFHTFQSISYLVDVYRGRMSAVRKPLDYALYLAFFPQLLAGPIVRAWLFFGELYSWRSPSADDISYGLARVGFGLFKKMAIADHFAPAANAYFGAVAAHPGAPAAWSAVFAFGMQIYFDFSGYSDIAIGCARLFGFVFPRTSQCRTSRRASRIFGTVGISRSQPGCAIMFTFRSAAAVTERARPCATSCSRCCWGAFGMARSGPLWRGAATTASRCARNGCSASVTSALRRGASSPWRGSRLPLLSFRWAGYSFVRRALQPRSRSIASSLPAVAAPRC